MKYYLFIMLFLSACGGSLDLGGGKTLLQRKVMPNGYLLERLENGHVCLLGPFGEGSRSQTRSGIVNSKINQFAVRGDLVFGYGQAITNGWNIDLNFKGGYFVCNMKTGEVKKHMTREELEHYTKDRLKIKEVPEMKQILEVD